MADSALTAVLDVFQHLQLNAQQIKYFMLLLGVPINKLDDIGGGRKEEKYARAWLDLDAEANWEKMIVALQRIGLKAQAERLKELKGVTTATADLPLTPLTDALGLISELNREDTRSLFMWLGVSLPALDNIDEDYRGDDRNVHYIQAWLDKEKEPSPEHIIAALHKIGKVRMAVKISAQVAKKRATAEKKE